MTKIVMLDTGPLSEATHPRPNKAFGEWLKAILKSGTQVLVPEIADYELRRELIRAKKSNSLKRLDEFTNANGYVPITTNAMQSAAVYWAETRQQGYHTASDDALDGDVILAAQASEIDPDGQVLIIVTTNVGHLARFVNAKHWKDIPTSKD